ncbi:MAG: double zinc ribbon domain-containing protein [Bacteroidota bacterium]
MQFCPNCKTEYTDEAELCADCGIPLVDKLPVAEPMDVCDKCGADIGMDSDYCPFCGTLFAEDQYSCSNHPIAVATGVCVICQQLFCKECISLINGKHLCRDHSSIEVSEGWALVFKTADFIEAEIIRGKLENAGIPVNPRNVGNISTLADGFIDNPLGRTIFKYPVKVFVPLEKYFEAVEVVNQDFSNDVL